MNDNLFPEELCSFIDEWWNKPGGLFLILKEVERTFGCISDDAVKEVSRRTKIYEGTIWGVVTHYSFYNASLRGRHHIEICMSGTCYHKGSQRIVDELHERFGIEVGKVTADGRFSLEGVKCMGACSSGPVLMIDGRLFEKVTPDSLPGILEEFR